MSVHKKKKINKLISGWCRGAVYTTAYLNSMGYSRSLLNRYKKSEWIQSIERGAYKLYNDEVHWEGALWALQHQLGLKLHIGGKSVLEQKGYAHYLTPQLKRLYLYCQYYQNLPSWMTAYDWKIQIIYSRTRLFKKTLPESLITVEMNNFLLSSSCLERAALEMLYHVPKRITFEEAMLIMENLSYLRPDMVQILLEQCAFIKTKRLFMYMAEKCGHSWFKKINPLKIILGEGMRQIVKNGRLNKKYKITVPKI